MLWWLSRSQAGTDPEKGEAGGEYKYNAFLCFTFCVFLSLLSRIYVHFTVFLSFLYNFHHTSVNAVTGVSVRPLLFSLKPINMVLIFSFPTLLFWFKYDFSPSNYSVFGFSPCKFLVWIQFLQIQKRSLLVSRCHKWSNKIMPDCHTSWCQGLKSTHFEFAGTVTKKTYKN